MLSIQLGIFKPTALYVIPAIEISWINKYLELHLHMIVLDIYLCFSICKENES